MIATYQATGSDAELARVLTVTVGLPAVGLVLLILGLRGRSGNPPRRSSATVLMTVGTVLLVLGAAGSLGHVAVVASSNADGDDTSLHIGQCISDMTYRAKLFKSGQDCTSSGLTYELAAKGGLSAACPDGKREHSKYDRFSDESAVLCFVLNLRQGQCYAVTVEDDLMTFGSGTCDDTYQASVAVVKRIDANADTSQCPPGSRAITYPKPARLYFLALASGARIEFTT